MRPVLSVRRKTDEGAMCLPHGPISERSCCTPANEGTVRVFRYREGFTQTKHAIYVERNWRTSPYLTQKQWRPKMLQQIITSFGAKCRAADVGTAARCVSDGTGFVAVERSGVFVIVCSRDAGPVRFAI